MSSELTKDQHFKFGYNRVPFTKRQKREDTYFISFGFCQRKPLDFRSECLIAARDIQQIAKRDLVVCLSGGVDSEIVAAAFLYARIPFRASILRFKDDLNIHDISWAVRFCESHGVPYEFIDMDVISFLDSPAFFEIAQQSDCLAPLIVVQMRLLEILNERGLYPVSGNSELILKKQSGQWHFFHQELVGSAFRFLISRKLAGQPGFFYWSPEMIGSFLLDPYIQQNLLTDQLKVESSSDIKMQFYQSHFNVYDRPKYRGYEKMKDINELSKSKLAKLIPLTAEIAIPAQNVLQGLRIP